VGTKFEGTAAEVRALDTYIKLQRAADTVMARLNRWISDRGLTVSQFGALEALYHLGPLHQNRIGEKLLKSSGNITMVVDNLEQRGLVQRQRDDKDRRCITVSLTDSGHKLIHEIFPEHVELIVHEMAALTAAEQEQLGVLCRKLGLAQR
jgi:MarR family 2-MHQ and catechol resistance regulon transcriptional repressor